MQGGVLCKRRCEASKCQSHSQWLVKAAASSLLLLAGNPVCLFELLRRIRQAFKQTYPLPSGGSFLLDNVNGSVQVDGWDRDEVEVTAVKTSQSDQHDVELVKIEVDSTPGKIAVHTRYPKGEGAEVAVEYHVHVPYRILLGKRGNGERKRDRARGGWLRSAAFGERKCGSDQQHGPIQREDDQRERAVGASPTGRRRSHESRNGERLGGAGIAHDGPRGSEGSEHERRRDFGFAGDFDCGIAGVPRLSSKIGSGRRPDFSSHD